MSNIDIPMDYYLTVDPGLWTPRARCLVSYLSPEDQKTLRDTLEARCQRRAEEAAAQAVIAEAAAAELAKNPPQEENNAALILPVLAVLFAIVLMALPLFAVLSSCKGNCGYHTVTYEE